MKKSASLAIFIILVVFGFLMLVVAVRSAEGHSWYDGLCCSESDCRQTTLGEVERHDNGWFVVPTKELIPFDDQRIKRSLDPLIHRCIKPAGETRCLYIPEIGG